MYIFPIVDATLHSPACTIENVPNGIKSEKQETRREKQE